MKLTGEEKGGSRQKMRRKREKRIERKRRSKDKD